MGNKPVEKLCIDGQLFLSMIKRRYGSIKEFSNHVNRQSWAIGNYIKKNRIPKEFYNEVFLEWGDSNINDILLDFKTLDEEDQFKLGYAAGYRKCLEEMEKNFKKFINTNKGKLNY